MDNPKPIEHTEHRKIFTMVRLAYRATLQRACELAGINPSEVNAVHKIGDGIPKDLPENFRIISFDGEQVTISERIDGQRQTRGFPVQTQSTPVRTDLNRKQI